MKKNRNKKRNHILLAGLVVMLTGGILLAGFNKPVHSLQADALSQQNKQDDVILVKEVIRTDEEYTINGTLERDTVSIGSLNVFSEYDLLSSNSIGAEETNYSITIPKEKTAEPIKLEYTDSTGIKSETIFKIDDSDTGFTLLNEQNELTDSSMTNQVSSNDSNLPSSDEDETSHSKVSDSDSKTSDSNTEESEQTEDTATKTTESQELTPRALVDDGATYVESAVDFTAAMRNSAVNHIVLTKDIQIDSGAGTIPARDLIVEGADGDNLIQLQVNAGYYYTSGLANITFKNLKLYSYSYYGPFRHTGTGSITYDSIEYYGAQLTASYNANVHFKGTIKNINVSSYPRLSNGTAVNTQAAGQQNIQATNIFFEEDCQYEGSTVYGGVLELRSGGSLTIKKNADVTLTANGSAAGETYACVDLSGKVEIQAGAKLTLNTAKERSYGAVRINGSNGIDINENASLYVNTNTTLLNGYSPIYITGAGYLNVNSKGILNINSVGTGTSTSPVLYAGNSSKIFVAKEGTFSISADGTGAKPLISIGSNSTFQFADAKMVNLEFTDPGVISGARVISMSSGGLIVDVQSVKAWDRGTDISADPTHVWTPMFRMNIPYSYGNVQTSLQAESNDLATQQDFLANFRTQNFSRLLYEYIYDVDVTIENELINDPASVNSRTIKGTATPNAYLRLTGDPAIPDATVASPVTGSTNTELTDNFTLIVPESGEYEYTLPEGEYFTGGSTIKALAYLGGKSAIAEKHVRSLPTLKVTDADGEEVNLVNGDSYTLKGSFKSVNSETLSIYYSLNDGPEQLLDENIKNDPKNTDINFSSKTFTPDILTPGKHEIRVWAIDNEGLRTSMDSKVTLIVKGGLEFRKVSETTNYVPVHTPFNNSVYAQRDTDWKIEIQDSRGIGSNWKLSARLVTPFTNDAGKQLRGGLYYVENGSTEEITDGESIIVSSKTTTSYNEITDVSWEDDEGVLLRIDSGVHSGKYQGEIEWSLVDGP